MRRPMLAVMAASLILAETPTNRRRFGLFDVQPYQYRWMQANDPHKPTTKRAKVKAARKQRKSKP